MRSGTGPLRLLDVSGVRGAVVERVLRSGALFYAAKFLQALLVAARRAWWRKRRGSVIRSYLESQVVRKLNIGAGDALSPGWLNSDLDPSRAVPTRWAPVVFLDAAARFPFADDTFHYVRSEHMIQALTYEAARFMLTECKRVLRPGGRIRIATPDLDRFASLHQNREHPSPEEEAYVRWAATRLLRDHGRATTTFVLNNVFRSWGHTFLFDEDTLSDLLTEIGFGDVRRFPAGQSDDPELVGVERHGAAVGNEAANVFETLVLEAEKPQSDAR